ncbi:unnamed protein product [Coffea canephora]|uniref:Uncharacterized protein n=1 Tax=Coffea canephora TaxID=49390 RepID=A0A068U925_COFCA|nr:unnamed protein product [Coffea canephora]
MHLVKSSSPAPKQLYNKIFIDGLSMCTGVANRKINKSRQCVGSINEDSFIVPRGCCFQELSQRNLASDYVLVILMRIFFFFFGFREGVASSNFHL